MNNFTEALEFVKMHHDGQAHANNIPVWHHLARVAERLKSITEQTQEGSPEARQVLMVSALGHDLMEDTKATPEEIKKVFGEKGYELIDGMTNTWGDDNVAPYVEKVSAGSEEVRLIKMSDLCDNISSVTYNMAILGKEWTNSYLLPIITPMKDAVIKTSFATYPKAAEILKTMVITAFALLIEESERF